MTAAPGTAEGQMRLHSCLLEGHSDVEARARRIQRRALLISILLQLLVVAAVVLIPLLTKGENISGRVLLYPNVPYSPGGGQPHRTPEQPRTRPNPAACRFCQPLRIARALKTNDPTPPAPNDKVIEDSEISRYGGDGSGRGIPFAESTHGPQPPEDPGSSAKPAVRQVSEGVQSAMLVHRVAPAYPSLARQLRHEGRVELRAEIATDGSIQSLEVISGDPLLIQSALAAVREWRYRPTILNGQAVEVETRITVIYTLSH